MRSFVIRIGARGRTNEDTLYTLKFWWDQSVTMRGVEVEKRQISRESEGRHW